jgi:hypothetical protein
MTIQDRRAEPSSLLPDGILRIDKIVSFARSSKKLYEGSIVYKVIGSSSRLRPARHTDS